MRRVLLGLLTFCGYSLSSVGQSGIYLSASTDFSIQPTTIVSVDGLAITPSSTFTITGPNRLERSASRIHTTPQNNVTRVYQFMSTTAPFNGSITFHYQDGELNGIAENALTLNTHNGSGWQYHPATSRDAVANRIVSNGLLAVPLNELTLADIVAPLPLSWGSITASRKAEGALVQWSTYNEENVSSFQVERSMDGVHWQPIGLALAAQNTTGTHVYTFTDITVTEACTYYRIRQIDANGPYTYSKIVTVPALYNMASVNVYPNPATDKINIQAASLSITGIQVFDAKGDLLSQQLISKLNSYTVNLTHLSKGTYFLKVLLEDGNYSYHQIIKQ